MTFYIKRQIGWETPNTIILRLLQTCTTFCYDRKCTPKGTVAMSSESLWILVTRPVNHLFGASQVVKLPVRVEYLCQSDGRVY